MASTARGDEHVAAERDTVRDAGPGAADLIPGDGERNGPGNGTGQAEEAELGRRHLDETAQLAWRERPSAGGHPSGE
jgi:hypothetical protein